MIHKETHGTVTVLRMERGKVNALDVELFEELTEALNEAEASDCRAVVLTGAGKAFSAGVDLFRMLSSGAAYLDRFLPALSEGLERLFLFSKPVVAAINGHAIAGGCIVAGACDYRIVARGPATLGVTELRVGVPFPATALEMFRFAVPARFAQEAVYSGATYNVEESLRRGLVDEIAEPDALLNRACEVAAVYGAVPTESFRVTKLQLRSPIMERAAADPQAEQVRAQWFSPEIHNVIREYLQKNVGKKN